MIDINDLQLKAAEILNLEYPDELDFFAWPEVFGSTAGPNPGFGGCVITTFTVFGFRSPNGDGVLHCGNQWKRVEEFTPLMKW